MAHVFHASVGVPREPDAKPLELLAASGVSVGQSPDKLVTAVVLGIERRVDDAATLAMAYQNGHRDIHVPAPGDVGYMILDHRTGAAAVIAAQIGLRQIFWATVGGELCVASDPRYLACFAGRMPNIRPEGLFQYIYFHMLPGPDGIFEDIFKLDGGHQLRWNGRVPEITRYWHPNFSDVAALTETDATQELHHRLRSAVKRSLDGDARAGAFLSGGLDSSTVAGLAAEIRPGIPTVSMGFDAEGYDEMEYARIASRHFGTKPIEYYVTPEDVLDALPMIAAAFPEPFGNSSAAATYHCARIAGEHGLELLLAGDGGDEIFGGNDRYAKQLIFERYNRVPRALRSQVLEPLIGGAGRITQAFPVGKALSYIKQANVPLPDRLQTYNFLHRHDPADVFTSELLARVDTSAPMRMLRDEYRFPSTNSAVNRMLFLDWKFTLHDNDLVKVNTMCALAGVAVAYPMLDRSVVDLSMAIPGDWKVHHGQLRWFYKRAMESFLPQEIISKTKHGFGLPFGVWTRTNSRLQSLSADALNSLGRRGFFRPEFLREALRLHREGHASYYGELVWILMVLELWLQSRA